ncbi:MAG: hypothetical protein ACRD2T_07735 [Thermoanaerobaculia bacterium]
MDAEEVIRRRFLSAFEQTVRADLPGGWDEPVPERGKLRQSAAVLLQVAERPDREAMGKLLDEIAGRAGGQEGAREQEARELEQHAEAKLWLRLRDLVGRVGETRRGEPANLFTLDLCAGQPWISPMAQVAREVGVKSPPATEETLTELARILLRAKARQWSEEDRRRDKEAG